MLFCISGLNVSLWCIHFRSDWKGKRGPRSSVLVFISYVRTVLHYYIISTDWKLQYVTKRSEKGHLSDLVDYFQILSTCSDITVGYLLCRKKIILNVFLSVYMCCVIQRV